MAGVLAVSGGLVGPKVENVEKSFVVLHLLFRDRIHTILFSDGFEMSVFRQF